MTKALCVGLCVGLSALCAIAQKAPIKFGDIAVEDLKMTVYPGDSSAAAVILCDFGESTINYNQSTGFSLLFDRIKRVKILTKDGLEYADFEIPLYRDGGTNEKVVSLKAVTYNLENGKIVETKLKSDATFEEEVNKNVTLTKLSMPNVKVGSIIEISYRVMSEFLFNFQDWQFQSTIPTVWSEYRAATPEFFNYAMFMEGYIPLNVNEQKSRPSSITLTSFNRGSGGLWGSGPSGASTDKLDFQVNTYRWAAKDVPAFKIEPFMTTYKNFISNINFELAYIKYPQQPVKEIMGTWEKINQTFSEDEDFGGVVRGNGFLKKIAEEATAGMTTDDQKIAAVVNYVKENVAYNGQPRRYPSAPLRKILDEKKGNSADINLMVASMLEKLNIKVSPVLISTRDHGFVRKNIPISSQFNYVICHASYGGNQILLDATERLLPTGVLPQRCLNETGLAISKEGHFWVKLESKFRSRNSATAQLTLSPDGALTGKLMIDCNGYLALNKRKDYLVEGETEYMKGLKENRPWEIMKSDFQNAKAYQNNFIETHELVVNENVTAAGDVLYIDPFIINQLKTNPFKSEKREYPVDFGSPMEWTYLYKLTVPDGYTVDELPKTKVLALPESGAKYTFSVSNTGNVINITSILQVNRSMFVQDEYPMLREFYAQVVAKQAEQIVLKKK